MRTLRNRILHQKHRGRFWADLVCMALGILAAFSAQAPAGPREKPAFSFTQTPSELKQYAIALGQRLQTPGKERMIATGSLSFPGDTLSRTEPVRIVWQFPLKIRLDHGGQSLTFDRSNPAPAEIGSQKTADIIQMLLEDSMEGFFALQNDRISRRYLGSGYTLEGANASDPGMDVVVMSYPDVFRQKQLLIKSYWFNTWTKLLGVVTYKTPAGALTHIVIEDWRDVDGEKIPFRIERWENNKLAVRLTLDAATVSAGVEDATLGGN